MKDREYRCSECLVLQKEEMESPYVCEGCEGEGWIPINQLPTKSMKVRWICQDGRTDVGFYYHKEEVFASFDLISEEPITHWKAFDKEVSNETRD